MLPEGDERQKQDEESGDAPGRAENGEKEVLTGFLYREVSGLLSNGNGMSFGQKHCIWGFPLN